MLIISSGMQKSGTAYFYNVLNDLLMVSGANDARIIKKKYNLEKILKEINNNADGITWKDQLKLVLVNIKSGSFAIKTHYANRRSFNLLSKFGFAKIIYSFRDPRDVILSVIDHGKKLIESGERGSFTKMTDLDEALRNVQNWIIDWKCLSKQKNIFIYKYEDLLNDPFNIINDVFDFIGIPVNDHNIKEILNRYSSKNPDMPYGRLHFNKGIIGRYKTEMSTEEQNKVMDRIGKEIKEMGYMI